METASIDDLKDKIGPDNVLTEPGSLFLYSYDAALEKNTPGAVALPRNAEDVAAAVRWARERNVPYVARGAGTNLCGGSVPAPGGLVIHLARLNRILSIDVGLRRAWVEPGVVNLQLQKALAPQGLFYAPDPASQKACTLGGNVGTNAGGPHCLKHGVTTHHVTGLEVLLPDGELVRLSTDDAGCDLTALWVGSEGTLGIVTKIEVRLLPKPEDVQTFLAAFPSMESAAQTVTDVIAAGIVPTTLEVMDRITVDAVEKFINAGYPREGEAVLLMEVDGPRSRTLAEAEKMKSLAEKNGAVHWRQARNDAEREKLWEGRRGSYPAMARLAPNVLVEDGVVPRTRLPEAVRRIRAIAARENIRMGLIAHAGDGNLHPNMVFDERDAEETRRVKAAGNEMLKVCVDLGGSISGEHGIGTDKREAMRWLFTPDTLRLFRRIKDVLDPDHLSNPDKLIPTVDDEPAFTPPAGTGDGDGAPETLEGLVRALARVEMSRRPAAVMGAGTKTTPPPGVAVISARRLSAVIDHDRENFTLTVGAGASLSDVARFLAPHGQHLHLSGEGTLGGLLSTRTEAGVPWRNELLGLKAVLAGGRVVAFGGKVMKNVAGYDAAKLFIGAWGTLGVIAELTLRLHARPPEGPPARTPPPPRFGALPTARLHGILKGAFDPRRLLNGHFYGA